MRNLFAPFAQRRHVDANHGQAVEQILAKFSFRDALFEVGVGGGQHAHVHSLRVCFADRHDLVLFEEAQQLGLHVERQVADLVEKERAGISRSHQPRLVGHRAGERAAAMAEQLTVGQVAAGGGAVVRQKHRAAAQRADMDGACDQLFAGAALAR